VEGEGGVRLPFLLGDEKVGDGRVLLFMAPWQKDLLNKAHSVIHYDGTFDKAPDKFRQLNSGSVVEEGLGIPIFFAALPRRVPKVRVPKGRVPKVRVPIVRVRKVRPVVLIIDLGANSPGTKSPGAKSPFTIYP
jgi:hypothetical protein